jgi:hypothetical protein
MNPAVFGLRHDCRGQLSRADSTDNLPRVVDGGIHAEEGSIASDKLKPIGNAYSQTPTGNPPMTRKFDRAPFAEV